MRVELLNAQLREEHTSGRSYLLALGGYHVDSTLSLDEVEQVVLVHLCFIRVYLCGWCHTINER